MGEGIPSESLDQRLPGLGSSLSVQVLGFNTFTAGAWVQSLVRELRYCKLPSSAKLKTKTNKQKTHAFQG